MQNPDSPQATAPQIRRVSTNEFPFHHAVSFEECDWKDMDEMRMQCRGNLLFFVATAMHPQTAGMPEEAALDRDSLVGFLIADIERDEDGEVYGSLVNLTASQLEEQPDAVKIALIRRWQEECRQELWDGLRAGVSPEQRKRRELLDQEGFLSLGVCPCCDAEALQWKAREE